MSNPYSPKQNNQVTIWVVAAYLAIYRSYGDRNNEAYRRLGGHFDHTHRRWLVPDKAANRAVIESMFGAPCFSGACAALNVVVGREYALRNGLKILEELGEITAGNPLAPHADSDLKAELKSRGYSVEGEYYCVSKHTSTQHNTIKKTIQIEIFQIRCYFAIKGPSSKRNETKYTSVGGSLDKANMRWLLPDTVAIRALIDERFGAASPSVIAKVPGKFLEVDGRELVHGGYVVACYPIWSGNVVNLRPGAELVTGCWDESACLANGYPCLCDPDSVFHLVVRRDYALRNGLEIVEELAEVLITNPLVQYADSDLVQELRARGYRHVERTMW